MPPTHCSLVPQGCAHEPQFAESLCRSVQAPLHEVWVPGHIDTQVLLLHSSPALQTTLQPPQFFGSLVVLTQWLLQLVLPGRQRHWLPWQVPPRPQTLPQAPQLLGSA